MNKKLRALVEKLYYDVKRKLNENIFLDPDICSLDDDDMYNDIYTDAANELTGDVIIPLVECEDRADVINYFNKTTGINNIVSDIFTYTFNHIIDYNYNIPYSTSYYSDTDPLKRNSFRELCDEVASQLNKKYPGLNARGSYGEISFNLDLCEVSHNIIIKVYPVGNVPNWNNTDVNVYGLQFRVNDESGNGSIKTPVIICNYQKVPRRGRPIQDSAIYNDIQIYNDSLHLQNEPLENIVNGIVSYTFNINRLVEELTCEPKIYKVAEKDIMRQINMLNAVKGDKAAGFKAIKDSKKMVARLVATFICGKKMGRKDATLEISDYTLIRLFSKNKTIGHEDIVGGYVQGNRWRRGRYRTISSLAILEYIRYFNDIHLKDVVATYLKYKDDPIVDSWYNKHI